MTEFCLEGGLLSLIVQMIKESAISKMNKWYKVSQENVYVS